MPLESYDCTVCGDSFEAYREANAVDGPYCSPACEVDGEEIE